MSTVYETQEQRAPFLSFLQLTYKEKIQLKETENALRISGDSKNGISRQNMRERVANHDANKRMCLERFIFHLFQKELCFPFKHLSPDGHSNKCEKTECRLNEGVMRRILERSKVM